MSAVNKKPKPKWWNNGWIGLVVLLLLFGILFIVGKHSGTYEPDPVYDGRRLSEWTDDLKDHDPISDAPHYRAVEVLKAHEQELTPILIQWLDERDTFPQAVYFFTMTMLEGKGKDLLDYRGAYFNQIQAANALRALGKRDPAVIAALQRVVDLYGGQKHYAAQVAEKALQKLRD
jgi:hypothetical protein